MNYGVANALAGEYYRATPIRRLAPEVVEPPPEIGSTPLNVETRPALQEARAISTIVTPVHVFTIVITYRDRDLIDHRGTAFTLQY